MNSLPIKTEEINHTMMARPEKRTIEILEALRDRVRAQVPETQVEQVERFLAQYYLRVTLEELVERDPVDLYGAAMAHCAFTTPISSNTAGSRAIPASRSAPTICRIWSIPSACA